MSPANGLTIAVPRGALFGGTVDLLEQHRHLYVGMTRARDHLLVCLHHKRRSGGSGSRGGIPMPGGW